MPCLSNSIEHAHFVFCDHTAIKIKMVNLLVSSYQCKGARTSMEDFLPYITVDLVTRTPHTLVGVYDGHGGHQALKYTSEIMFSCIHQNDKFQKGDQDSDLLTEAFVIVNRRLLERRWKLYQYCM